MEKLLFLFAFLFSFIYIIYLFIYIYIFLMSPSTSSQFQLNPNKKRKKKRGKREERKRKFEGTFLLGPEDNTSGRLITKPVSHTRKLTLWTTEEPFSHLGLTYRPRNCCLSLSLLSPCSLCGVHSDGVSCTPLLSLPISNLCVAISPFGASAHLIAEILVLVSFFLLQKTDFYPLRNLRW